jgi:hypothetical protein
MLLRQGSLRNDFEMQSEDGREKFKAYIRVNEELQDSFSIGLIHINEEGKSICLLRCNGKHGEHKNYNTKEKFFDFHIHTATHDAIESGEAPEQYAEITTEYATWQDALAYFLKTINVKDAGNYFPEIKQTGLFNNLNEKLII